MWAYFCTPQLPSKSAELLKQCIQRLKSEPKWPLDTMVEIGNLFEGPSRNKESEIAHFTYQDLCNSNSNAESKIRILCKNTFARYVQKLEKELVLWSYVHSKTNGLSFNPFQEYLTQFELMANENANKEPFSNQSLESCFAFLRNLEHSRHSFPSMLSRAVIMKNQSASVWLRYHPERTQIIKEILKSRQTGKRNSQQLETDMFNRRIQISQTNSNSKRTK